MKKIYLFAIILCALFPSNSAMAQGCSPNPMYQYQPYGLYPEGDFLNCSGTNAFKTLVGLVDTIGPNPLGGEIQYVFDAGRIISVEGLPEGLVLTTDASASATAESPYGTWISEDGEPYLGCISISGPSQFWEAAATGGTNGDGVYVLSMFLDVRVQSSTPDISFLIPNGEWMSNVPQNLGGAPFELSVVLDVNAGPCSENLFVTLSVSAHNEDSTDCSGSATAQVHNGLPPFTFEFSDGTVGTSTATDLCPGLYSVTVTDANGESATTQFAIASSANVYSSVGSNGTWPPFGTDTLYFDMMFCDIDYDLPIDSFYIISALALGEDTILVDWMVYQEGNSFLLTSFYGSGSFDPTVFSLMLWCENGRAEPGIFQLFAYYDFNVSTEGVLQEAKMLIHPNPTTGLLRFEAKTAGAFTVTDLTGRTLMNGTALAGQNTLDITALPDGIYLLRLHHGATARVVKVGE